MNRNKIIQTVLVAPLDWGLGHTTRCIPIIKCLLAAGCKVSVACDNKSKKLLENEFDTVQFLSLRGYQVRYAPSKRWLPFKIIQQLPKILLTIRYEHTWLSKLTAKQPFDLVISDNRFGLYSSKVPSIFITHQLQVQAPYRWLQYLIQRINYTCINRFNACWVPDIEGSKNIAAALSHPARLPRVPVRYIGPLSRFTLQTALSSTYKFLILLSGPEPQRSMLEAQLLKMVKGMQEKILFVRGLPAISEQLPNINNCTIVNHLPTGALQGALEASEFVISRSGYTTVMEILSLQKKAILIPTPGQTEQEYLASHLMGQRWCFAFGQHESNYQERLQDAMRFNYRLPQLPRVSLQVIINELVAQGL